MAYVTLKDIFTTCNGKKAVGAFNIHNLEFIKGVIAGAEKENKPVIMMINEGVLKYGEIEILGGAAVAAAKKSKVDVAVMVDHGGDIEFLKQSIDFGIDIMYDGSHLSFEENIKNTKMLCDYAHSKNRSIEGEIGVLGLSEDGDEEHEQKMTTPEEAVDFVAKTGVDVLAISVGNVHGFYEGEANINVDRIKEISTAVKGLPVVMHGGSDIPYETIKNSILFGIKKFNIATDLKYAYAKKMCDLMHQDPMPMQPLQLFPVVAEAVAVVVSEKIKMFELEV
ncbi:MAG: class II fructose-bisphosphate aldolase [Bacillota bacterium]